MPLRAVLFDVGETLANENRLWVGWADYLGLPAAEFLGALQTVAAEGQDHRRVFDRFRKGFDIELARRHREALGDADILCSSDLYPDALPCLRALKAEGYLLGIAGNQPIASERLFEACGIELDFITSSERLGIRKPSPAFFEALIEMTGLRPREITYVGDRLDNDVLPAKAMDLRTVLVARGPWGRIHALKPEAVQADLIIHDLFGLPAALSSLAAG
jgi:HAD superfamily hydrolase (TIGR01549 family)